MPFYNPYQADPNWFYRPQNPGWAPSEYGNYGWSNAGNYQGQLRQIQYGSQGSAVSTIQQSLNQLGFNVGTADGVFGQKTLAGVQAFQRSRGLTVDGIVGPKTWNALFGAVTHPAPPTGHLVQYGSQGNEVRAVQQRLNELGFNAGAADGIFGQRTLAAVQAFQRSHGLTVDGIVGPKTWNALFGAVQTTRGGFHHPEHWDRNSILRRGDSGPEVTNLQLILTVLTFYTESGSTNIDGVFGPDTEQAVKKYQKGNGLKADGIVGPKTWMSFAKFVEKKNATTYGLGGFTGLRIEWRYDSTSDRSGCTVLVFGNGTDLSNQFRLYPG